MQNLTASGSMFYRIPAFLISLLLMTGLLISCNSTPDQRTPENNTVSKTEREKIIDELKRLKAVFASGDKNKIAAIFPFPLTDTMLFVYMADKTYDAEFQQNGNAMSKEMFLKYYSNISQQLDFNKLNELFNFIKLDSLTLKDTLDYQHIDKTSECIQTYQVSVEKNMVYLSFGFNGFADEAKEAADMEAGCEYGSYWTFRFDGNKLNFVQQASAG